MMQVTGPAPPPPSTPPPFSTHKPTQHGARIVGVVGVPLEECAAAARQGGNCSSGGGSGRVQLRWTSAASWEGCSGQIGSAHRPGSKPTRPLHPSHTPAHLHPPTHTCIHPQHHPHPPPPSPPPPHPHPHPAPHLLLMKSATMMRLMAPRRPLHPENTTSGQVRPASAAAGRAQHGAVQQCLLEATQRGAQEAAGRERIRMPACAC